MAETQLGLMTAAAALESRASAEQGRMTRFEEHAAWPVLSRLPVRLSVRVPLNRLKVRDLLQLECEQVLTSDWSQTNDVPLSAGEVRLGWSEFEVLGQRIGVRLTQLA